MRTSVALASDNPGYDFDAAPALQAVIAAFVGDGVAVVFAVCLVGIEDAGAR
jgi:hypothetical protein